MSPGRVFSSSLALALLCGMPMTAGAAKLLDVGVLDRDYLVVHFSDGEVVHDEAAASETILRYEPELDPGAAQTTGSWTISSTDDANYAAGQHPLACYRKTKLNGHAEMEWIGNDYRYEYTYEHWIYLKLPTSLQQGMTYTLDIAPATNVDVTTQSFTFDIYSSRSEQS